MSWGSIRSLSNKEIQDIKNNPDLKRRIIPSRNAYRDKNRGADVLKAKCRTVVLGCCDPDLLAFSKASSKFALALANSSLAFLPFFKASLTLSSSEGSLSSFSSPSTSSSSLSLIANWLWPLALPLPFPRPLAFPLLGLFPNPLALLLPE